MASGRPPFRGLLGRRSFLRGLGSLAIAAGACRQARAQGGAGGVRLRVVAAAPGRFMGWPANHGLWSWDGGREILVGHADGPWREREGHNVGDPQHNVLARSRDGGWTWQRERPDPYVGTEGDRNPVAPPGSD
ncbi:MAG: hypothetical protein VKI81_08440, partial [Synechococcaceae cyanobacterium]|nr:hypothetical protein [Synechococcaceae cyanobacterium]